MSSYLHWKTKTQPDTTPADLVTLYNEGFVATRVGKGEFHQTRSFRVHMNEFAASSENRRIMRKVEHINMNVSPLPYSDYHWSIHKLAKDFYTSKFGEDVFSANKIKELMTDERASSFNTVLVYKDKMSGEVVGYCIALIVRDAAGSFIHYSYPFYKEDPTNPSLGLGMMLLALTWAHEQKLDYAYLGSLQRPSDTYKLQFAGQEWFDGTTWQRDTAPLKEILAVK